MTPTTPDVVVPPEETRRIPVPAIWAAVATLLVGLIAGFFIGRGTASSGPSSLADAFRQAADGSLPRGDVTGTIQQLGGFRALLGGGRTGTGTGGGGSGTGGGGTGGGGGAGQGGGRFGGVAGTVSAINGDTVTITGPAGDVKVLLTGTTTFQKSVAAARGDLTTGERVNVRPDFTAPSSGGQVNAGTVIIQPAGSGGGGGAGGGAATGIGG
jgi:hypothetical protein